TPLDEVCIQLVCRVPQPLRLVHVDCNEHDVKRRERLRPDDAALIVILLDGCADDAGNADTVAAHCHSPVVAVLVLHGGAEGLAVHSPELEYVSHLDAARDLQLPFSAWR